METMTTVEAPNPKVWTLAAVAAQERTLEDTRERIRVLADDEARLGREVAERIAEGEDATTLRAERDEARALRSDLEAGCALLAERIEERRELALRGEAEKRLLAIARAHGSARASYAQDAEKFASAVTELEAAAAKLGDRFNALLRLEAEALVLLDRFDGLEPPSIERVPVPAAHKVAHPALLRARSLTLSEPPRLPQRLVDLKGREAKRVVGMTRGSAGAEILAAAGGWSAEAHDERHARAKEDRRTEANAQREAEHRRLLSWLREQLAAGPVRAEVLQELARQQGWNWRRPGDTSATMEHVLRDGLDAFLVVREDDPKGPWFWTLSRADGFELPPEHQHLSGGLR